MAKYSNQVTYDIKTTLDASGITKLQSELTKVQTTLNKIASSPGKMKSLGLNIDEVQLYQDQIEILGKTISKCFNSRTGMLNVNQFNAALKSGSLDVAELNGAFKAAGNQGKTAFNSMVSMMTNVNKQAVTVNSTMSKIANTFSNTVRWGITASIFQEMMSNIQGAVSYMKDLDESLTNIQMVTNSSKEDMRELAQYANNAAQALGSTTTDYTNAVKVFVQEGFSESESKQYANLSTKLANVSEQNTATTSDQITAYRNAFQLDYEQTVEAMDKVANVANNTASNVNELMTASQRAASVAQAVGSSQDSFLAAIATIESVTRQSAEEIGNGLKTIYQRFADIKVSGGTTDDGVDYGQYAKALKEVGVDVLDVAGQFKGMDQILKELQDVWGELDDTMKIAVGEKVAGKFQYNRFAALMNNPEYYQKALGATQGASGMMDQMNEYYMEGIEGRLNTLQAAGEQVMSTLFNQDAIEPVLENVTKMVNGLNSIVEVAGGGVPIFTALSSLLLKAFSPQIASQISQVATNMMTITQASRNMKNMQEAMVMAGQMGKGLDSKTYDIANRGMTSVSGLDQASREKMVGLVQQMAEAEDRVVAAENKIKDLASQITTKYQEKLELTNEEAASVEKVLIENIKSGDINKLQIQAIAEQLQLTEEEASLIRITRSEANAAAQAFREMNEATMSLDKNFEAANVAIQGFHGEQIAKGFTQALSAVTSFAFGLQSITSWFSIMNDETASFEEKFNATLISLTMGISMLGNAFTSIKSGWNSVITGLGFTPAAIAAWTSLTAAEEAYAKACEEVVIAQTAVKVAMERGDLEGAKHAGQKLAETVALRENARATLQDAEAKAIDTGATAANGDASFKNVTAKAAETLAKKVNAAVTAEGTIANTLYTLSAKMLGLASAEAAVATYGLAGAIGLIAAPIAAVVGVIALLVAGYTAWQDHIHAASKEFENQKALLSETKKSYTDLRDEVESLKQSIDSIGEAKSSLADLTKGTDEWREAVQKLNDQVLTLLQTYPELAQYVNNEDGVLNIDQAGLDKFYNEQMGKVRHLADVNSIQQINTLQAQNNKSIEDFYNQWGMGNGISKEEIATAISKGTLELRSNADQLNSAFAELKNSIETNNLSINNLNKNVGTLHDYATYSTVDDTNKITKQEIQNKYFDQESKDFLKMAGPLAGSFSPLVNKIAGSKAGGINLFDEATKQALAEALGTTSSKLDIKESNSDKTTYQIEGQEEITTSTENLLNRLHNSENALDKENRILQDTITIYENFGAKYDEVNDRFIDSNGKVITSLEDLHLSTDELAAIEAFTEGRYNEIANSSQQFEGSLDGFTRAIRKSEIDVTGFSDALLAARAQRSIDENFQTIEGLMQTEGVATGIEAVPNIKFTPEQAKTLMADMMKKLNESDLSDDEKLQLMDKIDWNMPVQDILANIQHAIDIGNINSAFVDTAGLEDDSERKAQISEDYDIDESTLNAYTEQLKTTDELAKQQKELTDSLEYAKKKFGEESKEAKDAREALSSFDDESEDMAVNLAQTQKGLEALSNGMSKYGDILKNGDKTTLEYAEALGAMKKALADTLNISEESISNSTIEEHLGDIEALAAGDEEALNRLRAAAGQDIVTGFYMAEDSTLTEDQMEYLKQKAMEISSLDIEVGADVNDEEFTNTLNDMLYNGKLTKDQVNEYLHAIGAEPHFETIKKPTTLFSTEGMSISGEMFGIPYDFALPPFQINGMVDIPQIVPEGQTAKGGGGLSGGGTGLRRTASPTAPSGKTGISPNYVNDKYKPKENSGSNKSPKDNSPKQSKNNETKKKQKSEWDYLTDITNDLERQSAIIEKLSKLENRLYGANRVKQLKTLQAEHKKNIKLLEREEEIAKKHAERLRTKAKDENGNLTINGYAYRAGISQLKFDGQGNLDNGRQIEQALLAKVNQATKDYNKHRNDNNASYYNQKLDIAKNDYDGFLKAMSDYQATLGKIEDIQSEKQEEKEQLQDMTDAIVDSIQEGIEDVLKAMNSQRDFDRLSRNWKEGGNSYSHFASDRMYYSEGLSSLLSPVAGGKSTFNTQLESLQNRIKDAEDVFDGNSGNADDEKLSEQDAFENLQEATEHVMDSLNKMVDYYDSLVKTIQEASDKMDELIDNRLEQYDRLEDYLDTRLDQLTLLFGDKSYGEQAEFYSEKINVNMQKMVDISTAIKEKQATVEALNEIEATNKELSTEERKELQDARDKVNELQEELLSTETKLLQDISEKLKAQTSAEMNKLVKNLFNGADVEWLSEQWEIATRNSEKYLDDYNRAFELEKLQLKFQEALNDSQNTSLKTQQRIADLGDEYLTYLREKNKLSEYDVKQAEAQLNILQKQIALEEARDNKSQMRLQRNAAGNYDFVYAADQNAMNQAAEALLAAQQESYNLSKQKYLETYNSAYEAALKTKDMVVSIATDASISVEERSERIKFVLDSLNEYLQGSSVELNEISINLYNDFVEAENLIAEENQGKLGEIFEEMRINTAALIAEINAGIDSVKETGATGLEDFQDTLSTALPGFEGSISNSLNNIKGNVSDSIKSIEESLTGSSGFQGAIVSIFDKIGEEGSNSFDKMAENITKESDDGHLKRIRVGTINTANEISNYITGILPTIDGKFELSSEAILTTVGNIDKGIKEAFDAITGGEGDNVGGYLGQLQTANEQALLAAGQSFDDFKTNSIETASSALDNLRNTTQDWQDDLINLNGEISNCKEEIKFWKEQIDNAINSTKEDITQSNKLQIQLSDLARQAATTSGTVGGLSVLADYATDSQHNAADAAYDLGNGAEYAAGAADQAAGSYANMAAAAREAQYAAYDAASAMGSMPTTTDSSTAAYLSGAKAALQDMISKMQNIGQGLYNSIFSGSGKGPKIGVLNRSNAGLGLASGGYTGIWPSNEGIDDKNGKWAILHQKELVLNATDTENILSAVELVRDIMSRINSIPSLGKLSNQNNFNDTIEQRVEINATFPGVTEAIEIKQALEHLADNAYQVANRYKY